MTDVIVAFTVGVFIGAVVQTVILALCIVSGLESKRREREERRAIIEKVAKEAGKKRERSED